MYLLKHIPETHHVQHGARQASTTVCLARQASTTVCLARQASTNVCLARNLKWCTLNLTITMVEVCV